MAQPSVLPDGLKIVGEVFGEDDFVVFGNIEGEVRITGALVIEASGMVRGNVEARSVIVRGALAGDAVASEMVRVDALARMVGDARAPRVNIVPGAMFRGRVDLVAEGEPSLPRIVARTTSSGALVAPIPASQRTTPGGIAAPVLAPVATRFKETSPTVELPSLLTQQQRLAPRAEVFVEEVLEETPTNPEILSQPAPIFSAPSVSIGAPMAASSMPPPSSHLLATKTLSAAPKARPVPRIPGIKRSAAVRKDG